MKTLRLIPGLPALALAGGLVVQVAVADPFTNVPIPGLPGVSQGAVAWADYDRDGRLDFLITGALGGSSLTGRVSQLWRNTGSGFTNVPVPGLPNVWRSSVAWGDYDNDGLPDFLITGYTSNPSNVLFSQVWRNTGSGFVEMTIFDLPPVEYGSVAWGDYDNDGRLDFLIMGQLPSTEDTSQLWRNTGGGFIQVPVPGLPGVQFSSVAWGDYDNDGRLDFLITGNANGPPNSQLWRNTGSGFTNVPVPGLPNVDQSSVAWGDYDHDGRLDFLLTGTTDGGPPGGVSQLWRNTGSGFTNVPVPGLPGVSSGSVAWGDYDNDGRLDFLIAGTTNGAGSISQLWRNTGSGFTNVPVPGLPGVQLGSAAWGDYNNDGRLDFLITGNSSTGRVSQLWQNTTLSASNAQPNAPTSLSATFLNGSTMAFQWAAPADDVTPAAGLSYAVRIGTAPGGSDILAPPALADGTRILPQMGFARNGAPFLFRPQIGATYYWSVQAVDTGFAGSAFSTEQHFTMGVGLAPPGGILVPGDTNGDGVVDLNELSGVLGHYHEGAVDSSALNEVLAHYWPYNPLRITNTAGLGGRRVVFTLDNSGVGPLTTEYSTNLVTWTVLGPAQPSFQVTDTNAPGQRSFYRLRWP